MRQGDIKTVQSCLPRACGQENTARHVNSVQPSGNVKREAWPAMLPHSLSQAFLLTFNIQTEMYTEAKCPAQ